MTTRPRTSTRDVGQLIPLLATWLADQEESGSTVVISDVGSPSGAGFSSETVLFKASWNGAAPTSYVLRLPPPVDAYPLFPRYELARQVKALRLVAAHTSVPVPRVCWFEGTGNVLGAPFFVMEAVLGEPVSDLPPYVFGSWVTDASDIEQQTMRAGAVAVLAGIHSVTAQAHDLGALELDAPGESALVRHVANQRRYYDWIRGDQRFPVIDAAFRWLDEHWPAATGLDCLSWGDARAANVLWRDFQPVAVLDWEAAAVAPPEVDLGWFIWFHEYFQRVAARHGRTGAPSLFPRHQILADYSRLTGTAPASVDWFLVYAELRQALTSIRVSSRAVHFGEQPPLTDPEDLLHDPAHLREVISGVIAV